MKNAQEERKKRMNQGSGGADSPMDQFDENQSDALQSQYEAQIVSLYDRIMNQPEFPYGETGDSLFHTHSDSPTEHGLYPAAAAGGEDENFQAYQWLMRQHNQASPRLESGGDGRAERRDGNQPDAFASPILMAQLEAASQEANTGKKGARRAAKARALHELARKMAQTDDEGRIPGELGWAALRAASEMLMKKKKS